MDFSVFVKYMIVSTSSETVRFSKRVVLTGVSNSDYVVPNGRMINY